MQLVIMTEANIVPFDSDHVVLFACKMKKGQQITGQVRNMKDIMEYNWTGKLAIDMRIKLH
jgi:hypothetical protein